MKPPQQLAGEREVVGAAVGAVVEDRDRALRGLGVGDRLADHGAADLVAEPLAERLQRLASVAGAHVGDVEHDREQIELGVEGLAGEVDDLHRLLDPLEGEVLGLGRQQSVIGRDQGVDREQPEGRGAIDQDHVALPLQLAQGVAEGDLAPDLAGEHQLGLGEPHVRRDQPAMDGLGGPHLALEHVGQGRVRVGVGVEVVGEVALRIAVDGQHVEPEPVEDVGERAREGGLAGAPLLREDRDRRRHHGDPSLPACAGSRRSPSYTQWCNTRAYMSRVPVSRGTMLIQICIIQPRI